MPCLTRHGQRWSHHHQRCLLGVECLAAQAIPTPALAAVVGLQPTESWIAKGIFDNLSESAQKGLSGNGMHLAVAGAVIAWTMSYAVPSGCMRLRTQALIQEATLLREAAQNSSRDASESGPAQREPSRRFTIGRRCKRRRSLCTYQISARRQGFLFWRYSLVGAHAHFCRSRNGHHKFLVTH